MHNQSLATTTTSFASNNNDPGVLPEPSAKRRARRMCGLPLAALCATLVLGTGFAAPPADTRSVTYSLDIPSQSLTDALQALALASGHKLLYSSELVAGKSAPALKGEFTLEQAVRELLSGTRLTYEIAPDGLVLIRAPSAPPATSATGSSAQQTADQNVRAGETDADASELEQFRFRLPEVLIVGSRITNVDIKRSENDVQPYTILSAERIKESGATTVEEFLNQQLTMNTSFGAHSQTPGGGINGTTSSINLRGLGSNETLILIDGRRSAGVHLPLSAFTQAGPGQPDINGIPLSAIERIEVIPSGASAIYGGAALGGVVNIVLKREFSGADLSYSYSNPFSGSAPRRTLSGSYGTSFADGRTQIMLAGTYVNADPLHLQDRVGLIGRGVSTVLSNNPDLLYTSYNPFVGAAPNIASGDGSDLTLKDGGTSLHSPITWIPPGTAPGSDLSSALLANAGTYNLNLSPGVGAQDLRGAFGATPEIKSLTATIRQSLFTNVQLFASASRLGNSSRAPQNPFADSTFYVPAAAPTNPFQQDVFLTFPSMFETLATSNSVTKSATVGLVTVLGRDWSAAIDYTWSQNAFQSRRHLSDLRSALATGSVNPFVDTLAYPLSLDSYASQAIYSGGSSLNNTGLRFAGPLGSLPAGQPNLTIGLEHRKEGTDDTRDVTKDYSETFFGRSQSTVSAYAETLLPLVAPRNAVPGVHSLDLQLAGRSEHYTVHTGTVSAYDYPESYRILNKTLPSATEKYTASSYTIGFKYQPVADVTVRASFATAFLPPTPGQLLRNPEPCVSCAVVNDPLNGGFYLANAFMGGNPDLAPQTSRSWNLGLIWEPQDGPVSDLRVGLEYYKITQPNYIVSPTVPEVMTIPALADRVTRDPTTGRITLVDITYLNATEYKTSGFDLKLDYSKATAFGTLQAHAAGTWIKDDLRQVQIGDQSLQYAGYPGEGGVVKLKANAGLTWDYRGWKLGWSAVYYGSYYVQGASGGPTFSRNPAYAAAAYGPILKGQGSTTIPSQMYNRVFGSYTTGDAGRTLHWLDNLTVQASIDNVLNELPPFEASQWAYYYSPLGDPRLRSYTVSVKKSF